MILQFFWPWSDDARPCCKGLLAPEGKILSGGREGAWLSPAIDADRLLATWFREGTISTEVAIYTPEDFSESPLSPRFQLKMPDIMRGLCCSLPNFCFPAVVMRMCFMCPEVALIVLEDWPGQRKENFFVISHWKWLASFYTYKEKAALSLKTAQLKRCKYKILLSEQ